MIQLFFNKFVNLKINPEQAVQDWNTEQEATNKSISSHNHSPLANGPSKDVSQQWDLSRSSQLKNRAAMVIFAFLIRSFRASSIHQQFDVQQRRKQISFFYKSSVQLSGAYHCFLPKQPNTPTGAFPACNKTDIPAGTGEIWVTTTDVLKATIILSRESHRLWFCQSQHPYEGS